MNARGRDNPNLLPNYRRSPSRSAVCDSISGPTKLSGRVSHARARKWSILLFYFNFKITISEMFGKDSTRIEVIEPFNVTLMLKHDCNQQIDYKVAIELI